MPRATKSKHVKPLHDVFKSIDMCGGDKTKCWEWQKLCSPNPIYCWNGKRLQAHRVVFGLKHGIHYDKVPKLSWTCGNTKCCNPNHLVECYSLEHMLARRYLTRGLECASITE